MTVLTCKACGRPVRTAFGGRYPVHASTYIRTWDHEAIPVETPIVSPFVRRALAGELPAKVVS